MEPVDLEAVWWLHPGKLLLFFVVPLYLFMTYLVPVAWPNVVVLRAYPYLQGEYAAMGLVALLLAGSGAILGSRIEFSRNPVVLYEVNERFMIVIGLITLMAYLIWFGPMLVTGNTSLERDELNRIPGVTSFTQFGVTFAVCYMYAALRARQQLSRVVVILFCVLLVFTLARVYIWMERLAMIELGIPTAISILAYVRPRRPFVRKLFKIVSDYGPFLGIPLLLAFFTATEVVRSWTTYSQTLNVSLSEFVVSRVTTYYYTALNNGAGLLATTHWPTYKFEYVAAWFYALPMGIGHYFADVMGIHENPAEVFLSRYADVEFNNMSGIFTIIYDVGYYGGILYFSGFGLAAGILYRGVRMGRPYGILFFPSMMVACFEIMRIDYINGARYVLIAVSAGLAITQMQPKREKTARSPGRRSITVVQT
ncbi:MAG: putative rane protein [Myxococcaceae bacterium]|nr:putative rane protein [Myxococcaceae bacterium]